MRLALVFNPFSYKLHEENLKIVQRYFGLFPPLSLTWVAAIAEKAGHDVTLIDARTLRLTKEDVLARLRPSAYLLNTARGAVVDTTALTDALQRGALTGAALDVTDPEPLPADHPLFSCENCILTPHVAARTFGGLRQMFAVVDDVLEYLRSERGP